MELLGFEYTCMKVPWHSVFSFFFFFCLDPMVKKKIWMRQISVTVMVITSKVLFWKLLDISKNISDISYVQSIFLTFTRHIDNGISKTPCSWRFFGNGWIRANSSLDEYHETKMGEGAQKTISCTKVWACFMKNISLIVFFFFSQANLDFKFNLVLIEQFSPQFIHLFIFWYFVYLGVHPVPLYFFR